MPVVGADQLRRVGCAVVGRVDVGPAGRERDLGVDLAVDGLDRHREGAGGWSRRERPVERRGVGHRAGRALHALDPVGQVVGGAASARRRRCPRASAGRSSAPWPGRRGRRRSPQLHAAGRQRQADERRPARTSDGTDMGAPCHRLRRAVVTAGRARARRRRRSAGEPGMPLPSRRPVGLGQVDRRAAGGRGAGGRGAGPGEDQGVLALEEPVAADPAGGAALAGVLRERRHLDRARLGAGQRRRRAAGGDHDGRRRVERAEPDERAGPPRA